MPAVNGFLRNMLRARSLEAEQTKSLFRSVVPHVLILIGQVKTAAWLKLRKNSARLAVSHWLQEMKGYLLVACQWSVFQGLQCSYWVFRVPGIWVKISCYASWHRFQPDIPGDFLQISFLHLKIFIHCIQVDTQPLTEDSQLTVDCFALNRLYLHTAEACWGANCSIQFRLQQLGNFWGPQKNKDSAY